MWIEEIFIDRFGGLSHVPLSGLAPGLNVVVGPNEAGKSTFLEFIRSIFFGFKRRSVKQEDNTYQTPDGSLRRGRLLVRTSQGERLRLERSEQTRRKEGVLTITDEQGNLLTEDALPVFRLGMERAFFEILFAFDLEMMRRLDRDSLRSKIIGTALGSAAANPLEVLKQVTQRLNGLEKKSSKDETSFHGISVQLGRVSQDLKALREMPRRYAELKDRFESVNKQREETAGQVRRTQLQLETINLLLGKEWECIRLAAIEPQIPALEDSRTFPVNGEPELNRLLEKRSGSQEEAAELLSQLERLQERMDRIHPDEVVIEHSDTIRALARQAQVLMPRPGELEKLRAEVNSARRNLDAAVAELGAGWDHSKVAASDPSLVLDDTISRFADSWKAEREKIRALEQTLGTVEETCRRIEEKISLGHEAIEELGSSCEGFLTGLQRNLLAQWKERNNTAAHMRDRLSDKNAVLERLAKERDRLQQTYESLDTERGRELSWVLMSVLTTLLACCGVGICVAAQGSAGPSLWVLLLSGAGLVVLALLLILWNIRAVRTTRASVRSRKERLSGEMGRISAEIADVAREQSEIVAGIRDANRLVREIAANVLGNPDADSGAVQAAETLSIAADEAVRRRKSIEDGVLSAQQDLEAEQRRRTQIQDELARARQRFTNIHEEWKRLLADQGLDEEMEPETARELVRRLSTLKREQRNLAERETTLVALVDEWEEFTSEVHATGLNMGRPLDPRMSPLDVVARWNQAQQEARDAESSRKTVREKLEDMEARLGREQEKIVATDSELAALLRAAGAGDIGSFRELARRHAAYQDLEKERRNLVAALVAGLKCADEPSMRDLIQGQDWAKNHATAEVLQADLERLREESEELAKETGSLSQAIANLEAEEEAEALSAEKERLVACLQEKAREWIVLRLASELLERTIRLYESQKQPKVMERCSMLFKDMTAGAFTAVRVPMDGVGIRVERADGSTAEQGVLSRGTLEQLYLCLRLAHLDVYHRVESTVPLAMDDVLVNFDPERAARTAQIFAKFAEDTGIQVLFFTCHPHTASLFPRDVRRVELSEGEEIDH